MSRPAPRPLGFALLGAGAALTASACQVLFGIDASSLQDETSAAGGASGGVGGSAGATGAGGSMGAGGGVMGDGGGGGGGGGTLQCDEGKTECGGTCFDLLTDSAHCGDCLRDCAGLACEGGVCASEAVVQGEVAPYALVQDQDSLYWASPAKHEGGDIPRVRGVRKDNASQAAARDVIKAADVRSSSLAIDGTKLFWGALANSPTDTANQRLAAGTIDTSATDALKEPEANIQRVIVHSGKVYWTADDVSGVRGIAADGSGSLEPNITGQGKPRWLTIDADNQLYWISETDGAIRRQSQATPPLETVVGGGPFVSVELSAERVYWARRAPDTVVSAPKEDPSNSQKQTTEFGGQGRIEGFTLEQNGDAVTLYVVTFHEGALQVWRKRSDAPIPVRLGRVTPLNPSFAGNPFGAAYVLVDGAYVYFADVGTITGQSGGVSLSNKDGIIYRVAK